MWGPKSPKGNNVSCRCHSLPNPSSSSGPHDSSGLHGPNHSQETIQATCCCSSNSLDSLTAQLNSLAEPLCQLTSALDSINAGCGSQESLPAPQQGQPSNLSLAQDNLSGSESVEAIEFCCVQTSTVQTETRQPEPAPHQNTQASGNPLEVLCKCLEKAATKHHCPGS